MATNNISSNDQASLEALRHEINSYIFPTPEGHPLSSDDFLDVIADFMQKYKTIIDNRITPPRSNSGGRVYWGCLSIKNREIRGLSYIKSYGSRLKPFSYTLNGHLQCSIPFKIRFESCRFIEAVQLVEMDFDGGISFENCNFFSGFECSRINVNRQSSFKDNEFYSSNPISFEECWLDASLKGSKFHAPVLFSKVVFDDYNFTNIEFNYETSFYECEFKSVPDFSDSAFHAHTKFYKCFFNKSESSREYASSDASRFRLLKNKMLDGKEDREASMFHSLELSARHRQLSLNNDFIEKTISYLYYLINVYGWDISRPLLILFNMWIGYAMILDISHGLVFSQIPTKIGWELDLYNQDSVIQALFFSGKSVIPPLILLGGATSLVTVNLFQHLLNIIILIVSSLIWTMWVFSVRRRFKIF